VDLYSRTDDNEWVFQKRAYIQTVNLPNGATHTESITYIVPQGVGSVSFKVKIDAEDEAYESNEGDNWSRIETFSIYSRRSFAKFLEMIED
jgi:subtilase family serine protease